MSMSTAPLAAPDLGLPKPLAKMRKVGTAELRETIGSVLGSLQEGLVVVNRTQPRAVLLPIDVFMRLVAEKNSSPALDFLTETYRQMAAASTAPAAQAAADAAFAAGPEVFAARPLQ
jgi:hypothetical protein